MERPRLSKLITVGATFSSALAIGFVMQNGDALAARFGGATDNPVVEPAFPELSASISVPVLTTPLPEVQIAELSLPDLSRPVLSDISTPILVAATEPDISIAEEAQSVALSGDCAPEMTAEQRSFGLVDLDIAAGCYPNARLTVHHQGMIFTAATDRDGALHLSVPALTEDALFIAAFDSGVGAVASIDMPEVATLDRAVLQWQGAADVGIHAYENGADFASEGHVWREAPRDPSVAASGRGFLVRLGDPNVTEPMLVEVYTFPSELAVSGGEVELDVEAAITMQNCGRDVAAQSIQIGPDHDAEAVDLELRMPDCDAAGDYLLLKNMFEDLTLAAK